MTEKKMPFIFLDEMQFSREESLRMKRAYRNFEWYIGWKISERFDERYDTEVGGRQHVIHQEIGHKKDLHDNSADNLEILQSYRGAKDREPLIMDYETGDSYSLEEAETMPELEEVVVRLKERIADYQIFTETVERHAPKPEDVLAIGYNNARTDAQRSQRRERE